jgi:putative addiction module component (TIGR02574 family)
MSAVQTVLESALKLTLDERADLALQLLLSLEDGEADADAAAAWQSELEARLAVVASGDYKASHWRDAIADIRRSLKE